jgi:hypothetical protein
MREPKALTIPITNSVSTFAFHRDSSNYTHWRGKRVGKQLRRRLHGHHALSGGFHVVSSLNTYFMVAQLLGTSRTVRSALESMVLRDNCVEVENFGPKCVGC